MAADSTELVIRLEEERLAEARRLGQELAKAEALRLEDSARQQSLELQLGRVRLEVCLLTVGSLELWCLCSIAPRFSPQCPAAATASR